MVCRPRQEPDMSEPTRREALAAAAGAGLGVAAQPARQKNLVAAENEKEGTTDWQLTYVKFDAKAKYRQSLIEGFCTHTSVAAGGKKGFFVRNPPPSAVSFVVLRLG